VTGPVRDGTAPPQGRHRNRAPGAASPPRCIAGPPVQSRWRRSVPRRRDLRSRSFLGPVDVLPPPMRPRALCPQRNGARARSNAARAWHAPAPSFRRDRWSRCGTADFAGAAASRVLPAPPSSLRTGALVREPSAGATHRSRALNSEQRKHRARRRPKSAARSRIAVVRPEPDEVRAPDDQRASAQTRVALPNYR
jgi:hypothetical protein